MATSLPPGWAVTETIEDVPNPNRGTPYGQTYFRRKTYICTDEHNQFVAASGDRGDCETQAQAMAESRTQQRPYDQPI